MKLALIALLLFQGTNIERPAAIMPPEQVLPVVGEQRQKGKKGAWTP